MKISSFKSTSASIAITTILGACGGGGGGGGVATTAPTLLVSGTAATGAAIASGTVTLKCVSGTSTTATTGTDGSFSIDVSTVTLPCVSRVDYKDSTSTAQKLHTFISSTGIANITPVTELLVANLTGGTAADAFDKFDATKAKAFTATQIKAAADTVKTYLKNTLGVDTTNLPDDPVGTKLSAKVGSTAGDKFDAVLDDLAAKLKTNGKKLSDAVSDLGKSNAGGGSSGGNAAGSGAYSNVTAIANAKFLTNLAASCTKDASLSDANVTYYRNCKQDTSIIDKNLVWSMRDGGLPNSGAGANTGPGVFGAATVSATNGITDVTVGQSCKFEFFEPVIPIIGITVNATAYTGQLSLGYFNFNGSSSDVITVTSSGVVSQYTMTDGKGNYLTMQYDTTKGSVIATVGAPTPIGGGKWFTCK